MSSIVLRSAHWKSSSTYKQRSIARGATHEVRDRLEEKPPARLGIDRLGERQRTDAGREVRSEAGDLASVARDVLGQHRHRRAGDVLGDRLAERLVGRVHVLVARAEQDRPVLRVRDAGDGRGDARLAGARLSAEEHGLDGPGTRHGRAPRGSAP